MQRFKHVADLLKKRMIAHREMDACLRVIDYIVSGEQELSLSYSTVAELIREPQSSAVVMNVINLLTNDDVGVLKPELRILWNGRLEALTPQDVDDYLSSGKLADPESGKLLADPDQHVVPVFRASPKWLRQEVAP